MFNYLKFFSDRRDDLRLYLSPTAPARLLEHKEILDSLWPKGDQELEFQLLIHNFILIKYQ